MAAVPGEMTAIDAAGPGGPEMLEPVRRPVPEPGPGEVLIEVAAAGVNRPDLLQRRGLYPPPPGAPSIPGLEVAGRVAALGPGVSGFEIADRVCALLARDGEAALVHGGTSGIGTMAIRLAGLFGIKIIVTCGSDDKCRRAEALGADH